jgi:hypothetical protein
LVDGVVKQPFYGGYGIMAVDGLPKPAFNACRIEDRARRNRFASLGWASGV